MCTASSTRRRRLRRTRAHAVSRRRWGWLRGHWRALLDCSADGVVVRRRRRRAATRGRTPRCRPVRAAGWPPRPAVPQPRSAAARGDVERRRRPGGRGRGPRPPAPSRSRPTSNCGLTIGQQVGRRAGRRPMQRGQHQPQRDEGQVGDHQVDRAADGLGGQRAHVGALVHDGPGRRCAATRPARRSRRRRRPPRRAPRDSSTSVKPPVEAPASSARRPATATAKRVQGADQLVRTAGHPAAARRGRCGRRPGCRPRPRWPAWSRPGRRRRPGPRRSAPDGVLAGAGQPPADEFGVEPGCGGPSGRPGGHSWSIVASAAAGGRARPRRRRARRPAASLQPSASPAADLGCRAVRRPARRRDRARPRRVAGQPAARARARGPWCRRGAHARCRRRRRRVPAVDRRTPARLPAATDGHRAPPDATR